MKYAPQKMQGIPNNKIELYCYSFTNRITVFESPVVAARW